jgi:predicted DsbA family dithiol-disulfide isomerase|mmetsp:Transcript_43287/g.68519  ORF Transcript_43287/g.68519 Transcript_43287/m.68519 type:complete len:184 (-) Transcript_43287:491-1042(-)|eukprot:CAMPEP_0169082472 /NCGR_PEP_ID=MMETSP1015-20121227/11567_1 /TAXON_ID=342587 /ORGANISM="Karlodinium micrum, Strain CCMP2283" /LENGTH=183 /DNA_ID=CAMNT_0009142339 /DNA_START=161 /DNA_END=712 /DNA_ORIENTATION=+
MAIASVKDDINVDVSWEPYLLKESGPYAVPPEGRPILPLGAEPQFHKMADRGRAVGIDMTGDVSRVPNTRLSHILLEWAHEQRPEGQHQLKELIFQAYYSKNIYLGDIENLVSLATQAGYDGAAARAHLASGRGEAPMVRKAMDAKKSGVDGIPYFIINDKIAFSGAQDPTSFKDMIRKASQR